MRKVTRQPGSEKLWVQEDSNMFWCSVILHDGRTSRQFNGPTRVDAEEARAALNEAVIESFRPKVTV